MDYVNDVFGSQGMFAQTFPGYEPRAGQLLLAQAVDHALANKLHLIAEGPCGIGKSFAYAVPAIWHALLARPAEDARAAAEVAAAESFEEDGSPAPPDPKKAKRVVIATANIALQEQLITKDLPTLARILPWGFQFALLKGLSNYLCRRKLQLEQPEGRNPEIEDQLDQLSAWARETALGDVSELPFVPDPRAWAAYSCSSDECHGRRCDFRGECYATTARKQAREADVVVTNYHMLFAHVSVRMATGRDQLLPPHRMLICDEAHEIADIARDFFGWKVSEWVPRRMARWATDQAGHRDLGAKIRRLGGEYFDALSGFARSSSYSRRLTAPGMAPSGVELAVALQGVQVLAQTVVNSPAADNREKGSAESIARQCQTAAVRLQELDRLDNEEMVYFLDVNKAGRAAAAAKLLEPGHVLNRELFGRLDSAILTSATLTCAGSFSFVREQVGAPPEMLELAVDTPFNFSQQAVLVLPDMPDPRAPEYPEAAVSVTQRVIEICGGRTLVLCTSYRSLEALHNHLRRDRAHRVLRQGELPRTELAKIFREDEQSVLLGCESFWTGIDVPGPALTALVIDKLPFPNIQDPVVDAISDHNPAAFQEFMVPTAILMFRQGVGRLIRRADDVGAVVVLDCRLRTKGYGGRFLDSLPAMYQTANVEEIGQFLAWAGRPVAQDALGEQSELWARAPAPVDAGPPPLLDDEIPF